MRFVWIGLSPRERIRVNIFQNSREWKDPGAISPMARKPFLFAKSSRLFCPCCLTVMPSEIIRAIFLCIFSRERPFIASSHVRRVVILSNQRPRMWTVCHSTLFHCSLVDQSQRSNLLCCCCQNANSSYFCDLVEKLEKNFFVASHPPRLSWAAFRRFKSRFFPTLLMWEHAWDYHWNQGCFGGRRSRRTEEES